MQVAAPVCSRQLTMHRTQPPQMLRLISVFLGIGSVAVLLASFADQQDVIPFGFALLGFAAGITFSSILWAFADLVEYVKRIADELAEKQP